MYSDPISDYLTRIRNAQTAGHPTVEVPFSKVKFELTKLLTRFGYLRSFETLDNRTLRISLKYDLQGQPVIRKLTRVSKPGLRVYSNTKRLPRVLNGAGTAIVSTSQGLKTDQEARKEGVGGEVMCYVY